MGKKTRPAARVLREAKANEWGWGIPLSAALSQAPWVRRVQPPAFKRLPFSWA